LMPDNGVILSLICRVLTRRSARRMCFLVLY